MCYSCSALWQCICYHTDSNMQRPSYLHLFDTVFSINVNFSHGIQNIIFVMYNAQFFIARFRCNGYARHHFVTVCVLTRRRIKRFRLREDESLDFIIFVKICDFELFTYSRSQILLLAFSTHCCYEIKHFMS